MNLSIQAFRYAAEPFFFSNASEKNSPQLFARINHYFIIVCCIIFLGVSINIDIFKHFLADEEYWSGLHIVPILMLANLFLGVYYNLSVWFKLTDRTYYGTIITLAGMVITIGANYILIPIAGYEGSTWAAFICYFSMMVICYWIGQKYYPIPYTIARSTGYILITTIIVYAVNALTFESPIIATGFHFLVIAIYLAIVFVFERRSLKPSA